MSPTKAVQFADQPVVSVHKYSYEGGDAGDFWITSDEIRQSKKTSRQEGKEWEDKGLGLLLEGMYQNPQQSHLDAFTQLAAEDYMRGSESQSCNSLSKERNAARKQLMQTIIDREVALKLGGRSPDQVAQELAAVSQKYSQTARTFAAMLGRADELADKLGEDSTPALEIIYALNPKALSGVKLSITKAMSSGWFTSSVQNLIGNRQA